MTFSSLKPSTKPMKRSQLARESKRRKERVQAGVELKKRYSTIKAKGSNEFDSIMSRRVREAANWICARCYGDFSEQRYLLTNSHFIGRTNAAVRYDDENCDPLCAPCHVGPNGWETQKKGAYREFKLRQLGPAGLAALEERAKRRVKLSEARREFMERVRFDTEKLRKAA